MSRPAFELSAVQAGLVLEVHEESGRWYWGEPEGQSGRRRTGRLRPVGGALAGWRGMRLVVKRNVQSLPFPVRPQEAARSVGAVREPSARIGDTHNVVVALIQSRGVRHRSIHDPALRLVLCPNEVLDLPVTRILSASRQLILSECNSLTLPKERDRAPTSPPSTCSELASGHDAQSLLTDLLALPLPHFSTLCSCSSVQASRSTDLTRLMCVPIPR